MDARSLIVRLSAQRDRFVRLTRGRVPSAADAEDIVQAAMARAAERAQSLEDPSRVEPWFRRILQRTIADHYRSRKMKLEIPLGSGDTPANAVHPDAAHPGVLQSGTAGTGFDAENACPCGLQLMATLLPVYADVLRRVDIDDEPPRTVAAALAISESNLHVRLHRARRALRERLRAHCGVHGLQHCLDCRCDSANRCGPGTLVTGATRGPRR